MEMNLREAELDALGGAGQGSESHFPDARSCMPAQIPAQVPKMGETDFPSSASGLNSFLTAVLVTVLLPLCPALQCALQ